MFQQAYRALWEEVKYPINQTGHSAVSRKSVSITKRWVKVANEPLGMLMETKDIQGSPLFPKIYAVGKIRGRKKGKKQTFPQCWSQEMLAFDGPSCRPISSHGGDGGRTCATLTQVAYLHSSICVTRRCGALPTADAFSQLFLVKFHWSSWHVGRFLDSPTPHISAAGTVNR